MAQIALASSPLCGYCKDFKPKWDGVISALGTNYTRYFAKPSADEWGDEVDSVPQLIIRDTAGERMGELEEDMLNDWRGATTPMEAIESIKANIDAHVSYEDSKADDIVDLLTHLDLYNPKPSRFITIPEVNNATNKYEPDRRFYLDNTLENQYMVGDSVSYYGSDTIGSLNL
jgi:hypothetical protein